MNDMFCFENISKFYPGVRALDSVDFGLRAGEIHCLVGENGSGKSTMIKIICGVQQPESGARIRINGESVTGMTARGAIDRGIRVIYQDLALFPNLSVKENIAFGLYSETPGVRVNWRAVRNRAREAARLIGLNPDLDKPVSALSIAEQQQVEIARCIMGEPKLLILDEPTASLTRAEVDRLFEIIGRLKSRGVATLFVSHKLNEIFEIAQRVTVFRDGRKIGVYEPSELSRERLIFLMTGHEVHSEPPRPLEGSEPELLRVEGLGRRDNFADVSFTLGKGEILGITGRLGSGRTELALSLFGMNPPDAGEVFIEGRGKNLGNNAAAMGAGIAYVPENRLKEGLVMPQSIVSNTAVTVLDRLLGKLGLLDFDARDAEASRWVEALSIKIPGLYAPVQTLSGGNQQKVVLAKWLATNPKILILDEPTVGIDVLAKNSVHDFIKGIAARGMGIIMISDEVHEVLENCHRVLVMDRGRIIDEVIPGPDAENELLERFNLG